MKDAVFKKGVSYMSSCRQYSHCRGVIFDFDISVARENFWVLQVLKNILDSGSGAVFFDFFANLPGGTVAKSVFASGNLFFEAEFS